jgi:hypothetical protein
MIIRNMDDGEGIDVMAAQGAGAFDRGFGRLDVLRHSSADLRERFGLTLAETDFHTVFELVEALRSVGGRATDIKVRKRDLARLIDRRPTLLPCFVGYQQTAGGLLPFMTDGHRSRWSLFFAADGAMTLVENRGDHLLVTPHEDLGLPPAQEERPRLTAQLTRFLPRKWAR